MKEKEIKEILEEIRENTLIAAKNNVTTEEAAKYIGVSPRSIRKLASAHVIAYSKPNNKNLYFNKAYWKQKEGLLLPLFFTKQSIHLCGLFY